jgi:hypothetical protein
VVAVSVRCRWKKNLYWKHYCPQSHKKPIGGRFAIDIPSGYSKKNQEQRLYYKTNLSSLSTESAWVWEPNQAEMQAHWQYILWLQSS